MCARPWAKSFPMGISMPHWCRKSRSCKRRTVNSQRGSTTNVCCYTCSGGWHDFRSESQDSVWSTCYMLLVACRGQSRASTADLWVTFPGGYLFFYQNWGVSSARDVHQSLDQTTGLAISFTSGVVHIDFEPRAVQGEIAHDCNLIQVPRQHSETDLLQVPIWGSVLTHNQLHHPATEGVCESLVS